MATHLHPRRLDHVREDEPHRFTAFVDAHPLAFSVLALAATMVVQLGVGRLVGSALTAALPVGAYADELGRGGSLSTSATGAAVVVALLLALGWWRSAGFTPPREWGSLHLLWPFLVLLAASVVTGRDRWDVSDPIRLVIAIPAELLTGFLEEGIVRGVVLFALLRSWHDRRGGILRAVLVSSLLFGLAHFVRLLFGAAPGPVAYQALYATFMGIAFAAVLLRTNALWPVAVIHGLINVLAVALPAANEATDAGGGRPSLLVLLSVVLYPVALALYGLFLLRGRRGTSATTDVPTPAPLGAG